MRQYYRTEGHFIIIFFSYKPESEQFLSHNHLCCFHFKAKSSV